jgi:hypothetical protein
LAARRQLGRKVLGGDIVISLEAGIGSTKDEAEDSLNLAKMWHKQSDADDHFLRWYREDQAELAKSALPEVEEQGARE